MATWQVTHNDGRGGEDQTVEVEADRAEYERGRNIYLFWQENEDGEDELVASFNFVGAVVKTAE